MRGKSTLISERVTMAFLDRKIATRFAAAAIIAVTAFAAVTSAANAAQLVVFGSKRCPYCLAWEREIGRIYPRTEEAWLAPLRRVDVEGRLPADLTQLRDVQVSPTFVLVDEGYEVGRIVGYDGPSTFWPQLRRLLARLRTRQPPGARAGWHSASGI
jgi:thioredoxin-related protein